ncbi:exopolysaccharide biosynthesis protein [Fontibacillus solani]|uniref:Exopolysaccharide biosynthesis protein n=1 Tax=Fontibacillus solani TaxID=1572857 RepID=A0A7W3SQ56_9BACL|nr:phosphodiester glycosidase family protein [Fontibacillus solani]MBA9084205.1 exopolysaccharide biosynthesis protein [Fontibacillus solani]
MKRTILLTILAFLCLIPSSFAASTVKNYVLVDTKSSQAFIPVRLLNEFTDTVVSLNAAEKKIQITRGETLLTLFTNQATAYNNEEMVTLKQVPFAENGTTYVPLQWISESLGLSVKWDKDASSLHISYNDDSVSVPFITRGSIQAAASPIVSERKTYKVGSKSFSVQKVTISLLHPKIELDVALAGNTVGKVEDLSSIAKRNKAIVAINGTYFDAYTKNDFKTPYGYIVSKGEIKKVNPTENRTIFTYDKNSLAALIYGQDFTEKYEQGSIEGGLQAGPRLLVNGKVSLDVKNEGFRDPKILTGGGARSALGITRDHKLILLTTSGATIPQLAEIMKQAGAYQAMNLDGGASSGLYYNGKYLTTPGRKISNAIIVKYQ